MLNLLLRQPYTEEAIRTDFIDFCLTRLADTKSPYAVRAQCIKLAYVQMRYWPELLNELRNDKLRTSIAWTALGMAASDKEIYTLLMFSCSLVLKHQQVLSSYLLTDKLQFTLLSLHILYEPDFCPNPAQTCLCYA